MGCAECENLSRRHVVATDSYLEADSQRRAYVAGEPISGLDIIELAHLDQEGENTKRKLDDWPKSMLVTVARPIPRDAQAEGAYRHTASLRFAER